MECSGAPLTFWASRSRDFDLMTFILIGELCFVCRRKQKSWPQPNDFFPNRYFTSSSNEKTTFLLFLLTTTIFQNKTKVHVRAIEGLKRKTIMASSDVKNDIYKLFNRFVNKHSNHEAKNVNGGSL
jgi:hypothetical protein